MMGRVPAVAMAAELARDSDARRPRSPGRGRQFVDRTPADLGRTATPRFPVDQRLPDAAKQAVCAAMRVGEPVEPGDALVVATSGSTGTPKGVVLTHDAVAASADATSPRLDVDRPTITGSPASPCPTSAGCPW